MIERYAIDSASILGSSYTSIGANRDCCCSGCSYSIFCMEAVGAARDKLRLDLFDKRFALFEDYFKATTAAIAKWDNRRELFQKFASHRGVSKFLFDEEIANLVEETIENIVRLEILEQRLGRGDANFDKHFDEASKRIAWIAETQDRVVSMFEKYLSFRNIRK